MQSRPGFADDRVQVGLRDLKVGLLTGTGTYSISGASCAPETVATPYGDALVTRGELSGIELLHIARHEQGHVRLSNHVCHRTNVYALRRLGAECAIGVSVCGAVDPSAGPGSLVVFDDLHFVTNRLSDGSLCTFYDRRGDPERGHWIFDRPFSGAVRRALLEACSELDNPFLEEGCYGHVDGPRFNSRAEVRSLALAGVTAISQTCGPEAVLCGEIELPYALLGYVTDYANGVADAPPDPADLVRRVAASSAAVWAVIQRALPRLEVTQPASAGMVYRFGS